MRRGRYAKSLQYRNALLINERALRQKQPPKMQACSFELSNDLPA